VSFLLRQAVVRLKGRADALDTPDKRKVQVAL